MLYMKSSQLNIRTSETLVEELDSLVDHGIFRNRTEAVNEGIRLLVKRYKAMKIAEKIDEIADADHGKEDLTEALLELRRDEDV
ncbi:MAG: ribbon-helix-helix domain-containing protein [Candidatus Aenigmatarchaeota archaeon]